MKIAIIGTGNVGQALGGSLVRAGHDVTYAARDVEKTKQVAAERGAAAVDTAAEAVVGADVIILAVPATAATAVADELGSSAAGKLVIDVSNPLTPDYSALATAGEASNAERIAERLMGARVAKAFNTIFASLQANPAAHGTTLDALFATDDDEGRRTLVEIIRSLGLRPVDAGGLIAARELEALAFMNIRLQMRTNGDWRSAVVLVGAPPASVAA